MRARTSTFIAAAAILVTTTAGADPGTTTGLTAGLTAVQPILPWTDAGLGVAPWLGVATPAWGAWNLTARAGWIGHADKQQTVDGTAVRYENWELPVLVGLEYPAGAERSFLFIGELGYVLRSTRAEYPHEPAEATTDHGAGLALGGGYQISSFQARAQWFMLGLPDPVKHKAVLFGVQWLLPL